ncbi:peptidylprolyl isomerase [Phaeovulum sp.]|uniref:peptidylprolyl isomerase n=1 Tax=Phaeovulum sp. TaxID=2934796 RepID=UPI003563591F
MLHKVFAAVLGLGLAFSGAASAQDAVDGPGPNLVLDVAGQASGRIVIDLLPDIAPRAVDQIVALAREGAYDGVVFHRVIEGFMAQTGDVQFGKKGGDISLAGMGGSTRANLPDEFSTVPFERGVVGMANSGSPNSSNSQFFIMFAPAPHLDGGYTVIGRVVVGMEVVDAIRKGSARQNGLVENPDYIATATVR